MQFQRHITVFLFFSVYLLIQMSRAGVESWNKNLPFLSALPDTILHQDTVLAVDTLPVKVSDDVPEAPVEYSAEDSIVYDLANKQILLFGKSAINYMDLNLQAARVAYAWKQNLLTASELTDSTGKVTGKPEFRQGNQHFQARKILYNFKSGKGKIYDLYTEEGEGFIHGGEVKKDSANNLYAKKALYTTCDLEHPHFYIEANPLKIVPDKLLVCGPTNLVIEGVRTPLVLPFAIFPIQKGQRSGILLPELGRTDNLGYSLTNGGYYFGISDYLDLTLRGDIYTSGSWRLNASTNFRKRYAYSGNLTIGYGHLKFGSDLEGTLDIQNDFNVRAAFSVDPKRIPNSTFSANINITSADYNRYNTLDYAGHLNNTFHSSIAYTHHWDGLPFNLNVSLQHSQSTTSRMVDLTLPGISFGVARIYPFKRKSPVGLQRWYERIGFSYTLDSRNLLSVPDSVLFDPSTLDRFRFGVDHNLPMSGNFKVLKYFNLNIAAAYHETWYVKTLKKTYKPVLLNDSTWIYVREDTVRGFRAARYFNASAGLNTRLYGRLNFRKGPIKAIRHVITPNISVNYRPDFGSGYWGYYKTVQVKPDGTTETYSIFPQGLYNLPPTGKLGGIGLSINNNLEMKVRDVRDTVNEERKIKLLESVNLLTFYNLAADSLNLDLIRMNGRTTLLGKLGLNFNATWDPYVLSEDGKRLNRFEWVENRRLARLTFAQVSLGAAFNSRGLKKPSGWGALPYLYPDDPEFDYKYNTDWQVNANYSLTLNRGLGGQVDSSRITQSISFSGQLKLTPNWKISLNTGYDFIKKELVYTTVDIYRDLHCWEMRFRWIPIGTLKSYTFTINVKSNVLRDLKIEKKSDPLENF